jgi:hypothetical protein
MYVGKMHFHDRQGLNRLDGIEKGNRGVGVGGGIDDDAGGLVGGLVDPVDQNALMIGLA